MPSSFSCSPVICERLSKVTKIEKKTTLPLRKMHFSTIWINGSRICNTCSYSKKKLIFSNKDLNDIMPKLVKSLKDPSFLVKGISENVENEVKKNRKRFSKYAGCCIVC